MPWPRRAPGPRRPRLAAAPPQRARHPRQPPPARAPRQEAEDAAPHFTFCSVTSATEPGSVSRPSASRRHPAPPRPEWPLRTTPPGLGARPPLRSPPSVPPSLPPPRARARPPLYLLLMRADGAASARPLSGGCAAAAAAPRRPAHKAAPRVPPPPPARPGAALGLAVPRSSRRGGRRGPSVRRPGRHCRSPSG